LVLGGAGFIGSHVVEALVEENCDVRVFDSFKYGLKNLERVIDEVELVRGDFLALSDVQRALADVDYVFHYVWTSVPQTSMNDPIHDATTNIICSVNMIREAVNSNVKKIIFSSSGGTVYGEPRELPVSELHPTNPLCPYGVSKLTVEKFLSYFHRSHGIDYAVLRYSNAYGERQDPHGAVGAITVFLGRLLEKKPITIFGDGRTVRDYVYVKDMAKAALLAMRKDCEEKVFNVGSGVGTSVNEIVELISEVTGLTVNPTYVEERAFDVRKIVLDISRIERELGWKPETELRVGIGKVWDWLNSADFTVRGTGGCLRRSLKR